MCVCGCRCVCVFLGVCVWKEVKDLVRKKKTDIWNDVIEKVNADYEGSRKILGFCW